jgi:hypothetical protein
MDLAFGGNLDTGEPPAQALPDLTSTPAGVLTLNVQDIVLHLEGKLMGIATRAPAPVGQSLNPAFLVAIEDLVACLTGYRTPCTVPPWARRLAGEPQTEASRPSPNTPSTTSSVSSQKGKKCNPCVRYVLPMCRVTHSGLQIPAITLRSVRPTGVQPNDFLVCVAHVFCHCVTTLVHGRSDLGVPHQALLYAHGLAD